MNVGELVDVMVTKLEVESGLAPSVLAARGAAGRAVVVARAQAARLTPWTLEEETFVRQQIGRMSDPQIGELLGRSTCAIKIRRQRKGLGTHSRRAGYITANRAANWLGQDGHAMMRLYRRGMIPGEIFPGKRGITLIRVAALLRWAVNPMNWIYFRPDNVCNEHLRRLLELRRARWDDEWWSVGQAAAYHQVSMSMINKYIRLGKIRAVRWGNWWVLKSEATRNDLRFWRGKGQVETVEWSAQLDEFLVIGQAVGIPATVLDRMAGWAPKRASYRLHKLAQRGELEAVARRAGVGVSIDKRHYVLYADWRRYAWKFPHVGRAMRKFEAVVLSGKGERLSNEEIYTVRGVLEARLRWMGIKHPVIVSSRWEYETMMDRLTEAYCKILEGVNCQLAEIARQG